MFPFNSQDVCVPSLNLRGLHYFYSISYLYFGAMATSSVVVVGLIVSYMHGEARYGKNW